MKWTRLRKIIVWLFCDKLNRHIKVWRTTIVGIDQSYSEPVCGMCTRDWKLSFKNL